MDTKLKSEVVQAAQVIIFGNEGNYSTVNANDNGAVSVGKVQWHAGRALDLLKKICAAENSAVSILGATLYKEITTAASGAWNARIVNAEEKAAISKLLSTDAGKRIQDVQAETDVGAYVDHGLKVGVEDPAALVYFADMENQGGGGASARVAAAAKRPITLDTIHSAGLADGVMGKYSTRRKKVYETAKKLKWGSGELENKGGQNMSFTPRLTRPTAGNKYYIRKASGGYSSAVQGSPKDSQCDVLHNCVGYANGRFNEIIGAGKESYALVCNAEQFVTRAKALGLTIGQAPQLGAIAVWQAGATLNGSDGAGHVAVVEAIHSATEIVTSESGYNAKNAFWTQTRQKGSGNWGQGSNYKFLGFIYNPASSCAGTTGGTTTTTTAVTEKKATGVAKSFDKGLAGTYTVTAGSGLYIRNAAGTSNASLALLPCGTKVKNYGYYTLVGNVKWLYIQVTYNGVTYTGFSSAEWLKKQ